MTTPSSGSTIHSASVPSSGPPSVARILSRAGSPASQRWAKMPQTRSPGCTRVTPSPTSATSPTPSEQGISGSRCLGLYFPFTIIRSR